MQRLAASTQKTVRGMIERYDLHRSDATYVPIKQVARDEGWKVCYQPGSRMAPAMAFAVIAHGYKGIVVNEAVAEGVQRTAIAHELGHELAGHKVGVDVFGSRRHDHLYRRGLVPEQEREADIIASILLIPDWLLFERLDAVEMAAMCRVPQWLAALRLEPYVTVQLPETGALLNVGG